MELQVYVHLQIKIRRVDGDWKEHRADRRRSTTVCCRSSQLNLEKEDEEFKREVRREELEHELRMKEFENMEKKRKLEHEQRMKEIEDTWKRSKS